MTIALTREDTIQTILEQEGAYKYASNMYWGVLALDNSYPAGGYDVSSLIPGRVINNIALSGRNYDPDLQLEYDDANKKLKIKERNRNVPWFVYEEAVTVTTDVGTLAHKPGHILYIAVADGATFKIVDKGTTPGAGEVSVNMSTGAMTFLPGDSVTAVVVTYYPAYGNPWMVENLVQSAIPGNASFPLVTIAAEVITISGGAAAILCVDVDGAPFAPIIDDDTPGTGEYAVNWNDSGDTTLTGSGTEFSAATSIKITYLKDPGFLTYIEDASAHSADVVTIAKRLYLLRTSQWLYTDDNDTPNLIVDSTETLIANEVKMTDLMLKYLTEGGGVTFTYEAATDVAASGIPYAEFNDVLMNRLGDYAECEAGRDLSTKSIGIVVSTERFRV